MQEPMSLAGALLEEFREVRRRLAAVYGVDESVALEAALRGDSKDAYKTNEERVDELSLGTVVRATGKGYARNASGLPSDQLIIYNSLHNKFKDDPDYSKDIRDVQDQAKVRGFKFRLNNTQTKYKTARATADDKTKKEYDQRLMRLNNASDAAQASADAWAKNHPNAFKFHMNGEVSLPDPKDREEFEAETRKYLGKHSGLNASLLHKR